MLNRRQFAVLPVALGTGVMLAHPAAAQPAGKPVKVIVPLPAGGATDALARLLADKLRNRYANTILVDNRAGAGGRIGLEAARNGEADGSTLLFTPDFPLTLFPSIYRNLAYRTADFAPVASCGLTSMALAVGPGVPANVRSLPEFVAWAKAQPQGASYASPSAGSTPHLVGMMFARTAGLKLLHVPYKGGAAAIQDLLGGQVPLSINPMGEVLQYVRAGRLRVLATTGPARSPFLPDVPTMAEAGFKDLVVQSWLGMFAPALTPSAVVDRLNTALLEVIRDPEVVQAFARIGFEPSPRMNPAQFAALVRQDIERWSGIVKATGFTAEE